MFYISVYNNLCSFRSKLKDSWGYKSGLHRHHIIPRHAGGLDEQINFTYLTPREHVIAHFLLWKIYQNSNDLRSMHMLGAELTYAQRKEVGIFCRDNKIGFHGASKEDRKKWSSMGMESQKNTNDRNSFYWWSTEQGRKKRASLGGKVGGKKQAELKLGFHAPEVRAIAASLGGKAIRGMICVTNGVHRTRVRSEELEMYLSKGYKKGFTLSK